MPDSHPPIDSKNIDVIHLASGRDVVLHHAIDYRIETLVATGMIDAVIVDSEDGFSQLGKMRDFLSLELGISRRNLVKWAMDGMPDSLERNIASLADWNRARSPEITIVGVPSQREGGLLKGLILSPYDGSVCYRRFAMPGYGKPYRDFFYNVTYEAIAYAYLKLNARRIGVTHMSRSKYGGYYEKDVTTCQIEAMIHFSNEYAGVESFTFIDDRLGNQPLEVLSQFGKALAAGRHRKIQTEELRFWGFDFVDICWNKVDSTIERIEG